MTITTTTTTIIVIVIVVTFRHVTLRVPRRPVG